MKKTAVTLLLCVIFSNALFAQLPAYELPKPTGWGSETFPLPPSFAPEIKFKGIEDIRFTPGWSKSDNEQYWSYAFIWLLEGKPDISNQLMTDYMAAYYKGIYTVNLKDKSTPKPDFTKSSFKRISIVNGEELYEGMVKTLNYLNNQVLLLNVRVHLRKLNNGATTVLLFEVSPQYYSHPVWQDLMAVTRGFKLK